MAGRGSLLDDARLNSIGAAKSAKGPKGNNAMKLGLAVALFVFAGLIFAWSQGWIFAKPEEKPPPPTQQEIQEFKQQQQKLEEDVKKGAVTVGGA
jgi:hypothetical protein